MQLYTAFPVRGRGRLWPVGVVLVVLVGLVIAPVVGRERPAQIGLYLPTTHQADGAPASVAPLGWTAALIVLTQAELAN